MLVVLRNWEKMPVISITNQKGGIGKTTTVVNLAGVFAIIGKKVLVIDLDPQGNSSTSFGIKQQDRILTIYDVLCMGKDIESAILPTQIKNLDIVTSNINLVSAEAELIGMQSREFILKKAIKSLEEKYDYIVIDCPPSLGILVVNALCASTQLIIPMQCEFLSLEGLSHLLRTIEMLQKGLNPNLSILGVLLTMCDKRVKLTERVEEDVRGCLGELVFETSIPRNVRVSEAPSRGVPAVILYHLSPGAMAYMKLAQEILDKNMNI